MKKLIMTIAILLGMTLGAVAQQSGYFNNSEETPTMGGGMFGRGYISTDYDSFREDPLMPGLPAHLLAEDQDAPVGSGIAVLLGLGVAYAIGKRRKED